MLHLRIPWETVVHVSKRPAAVFTVMLLSLLETITCGNTFTLTDC
jgi:hypothetical protein